MPDEKSFEYDKKPSRNNSKSPLPAATFAENPNAVFDKKQRGLIVFIVSTAATCKY
jgi:hypothetical protein